MKWCNIAIRTRAQMAELVDALDSKSCIRKDVQVRFLFWALSPIFWGFFMPWKPYKTYILCFCLVFIFPYFLNFCNSIVLQGLIKVGFFMDVILRKWFVYVFFFDWFYPFRQSSIYYLHELIYYLQEQLSRGDVTATKEAV